MITSISHLPRESRATTARPIADIDVDALVRECLPLVHHHVRAVAARIPSHIDRDELVSAGMYALATCAHKYDPAIGTTFAQFASTRIRGALVDELRSMDWASRSVRRKAREAATTADTLSQTLGRIASDPEIAESMRMTPDQLAGIRADAHRGNVVSLQTILDQDPEALPDVDADLDAALLRREQRATLGCALAALPDRLRTVVEQYFFAQRKMSDIATDLGVTESRISQLRTQALRQLRDLMDESTQEQATKEQAPVTTTFAARTLARPIARGSARELLAVG